MPKSPIQDLGIINNLNNMLLLTRIINSVFKHWLFNGSLQAIKKSGTLATWKAPILYWVCILQKLFPYLVKVLYFAKSISLYGKNILHFVKIYWFYNGSALCRITPCQLCLTKGNGPRIVKGNRDKQAPRLYYTAMDITLPAPKTLQEWRSQELKLHLGGSYPRNVWTPLESFFLSQGYILWQSPSSLYQRPPNDAPRAPDGFAYKTVYCEIEPKSSRHFDMIVSKTSMLLHRSDTLSRALFTVQRARLTIATSWSAWWLLVKTVVKGIACLCLA